MADFLNIKDNKKNGNSKVEYNNNSQSYILVCNISLLFINSKIFLFMENGKFTYKDFN